MKAPLVLIAAALALMGLAAQPADTEPPPARAADVATIDAIIGAFYESTAGGPGEGREWDRLRSLFVTGGRLISIYHNPHGGSALRMLTAEDYVAANRNYFEKGGFFEREIARRTEEFGAMAHVLSTYESRRRPEDPEPYARGLYSIQLAHDGSRWWIVNVMWDHERPDAPLPERYLRPAGE